MGDIASQPGTTPYMQWFFAAAVIVSLLIAPVGLEETRMMTKVFLYHRPIISIYRSIKWQR